MNEEERKVALRRRTKAFAGEVVRFFVKLDRRREDVAILGRQMIRSGTSVGANYREASRSRSDAEFIAKIELCVQEADELISILVTMSKNTKKRATAKSKPSFPHSGLTPLISGL